MGPVSTKRALALLAAGGLGAAVGVTAIPALAATKTVRVEDDFFAPKTLTVKRGDTLKFVWRGDAPHNVKGGQLNSGAPKTEGTYRKRVTRRGTFRVVCVVHPKMTMRLTVK